MSFTKLYCIIDRSGSMAEYGKPMLLVNFLRYIHQFTEQHSKNVHYFHWQEDITELNWQVDTDINLPAAEGSSNTAALCNWGEANPDAILLVLTDGYFGLNTEQRHRLSQLGNLYLVGLGGDADLMHLRTLSNHSYLAEQLDYVLHAIWRPKTADNGPLNRVELAEAIAAEDEVEDDDGWE